MDDILMCERCEARMPSEVAVSTDDGCHLCPACDGEWQTAFKACDHRWGPGTNQYGEPSQICERCSSVVANEDFAGLFPTRSGWMESVA